MAQMCAFSILQKCPEIAKMTPNDLLTLKMILTESPRKTEQNTLLVLKKFINFDVLERKNEFHGNHANHKLNNNTLSPNQIPLNSYF